VSDTTPDEPLAAPTPSPLSVGTSLRNARGKTGKSLSEVATMLRIRQPYLLALEEGRHRDLPGGAYAIGFLRTYAEFLALDGEEMVRRFRAEASGDLNSRSELVFPSPVSEGRIPGGAVLFVGLLLAGLAYGGWYLLSSRDSSVAEMVPALPERLSSVLNRPASVTGETQPPAAEAPKPAEGEAVKPQEAAPADTASAAPTTSKDTEVVPPAEEDDGKAAKTEPVKPETPKAEPAKTETAKAEPVKPEPAKTAPPKVEPTKTEAPKAEPAKVEPAKTEPAKTEPAKPAATENADSRVQLSAAGDDCWIQVREMDGQLVMSKLLRKGDSYAVPNRSGLTLMVGNAGALDVLVDGKKVPSLGAAGQVRRDIRLDPDKLVTGG